MQGLQQAVVEEQADIGLAFDGDGDRIGMVDAKGGIVPADSLLMLLARHCLQQRKGNVVVEVRASTALLDDIRNFGGNPVMARAGHAYVLEEVVRHDAVFGGEITGHMYFPLEYYPYDDGLFIGVKLAEIAARHDLAEYVSSLPKACTSPEIALDCPDERKFAKVKLLADFLAKGGYDFLGIDGARISFPNGWALVRASNTTPHIKCRFEGKTEKDLKAVMAKSRSILQAAWNEKPGF